MTDTKPTTDLLIIANRWLDAIKTEKPTEYAMVKTLESQAFENGSKAERERIISSELMKYEETYTPMGEKAARNQLRRKLIEALTNE